jgi:hypothetical protein
MPSVHIATTFLGQPCGSGTTEGVNPEMHERLVAAERAISAAFDALPPQERGNASLREWAGAGRPHVCWRPYAGQHSAGAAIDINASENPYIVTRANGVPGGERGAEHLTEMRTRALAAYDRAMRFCHGPQSAADVSPRRPGEPTASVWSRFKAVSDALERYLSVAVDPHPEAVLRTAIENADELSDDVLLALIPEGERLPLEVALQHATRDAYFRALRDYEHARIPLAIGEPSATPERTRNPARGFLHLRREIVTALCDAGLRWGACDLEIASDGTSHNGAMMHFDLADSGGYPEVHSLLRFG